MGVCLLVVVSGFDCALLFLNLRIGSCFAW